MLPKKFNIHNLKNHSRYEGFSNNFIFGCSSTFKRLGNTGLASLAGGSYMARLAMCAVSWRRLKNAVISIVEKNITTIKWFIEPGPASSEGERWLCKFLPQQDHV